MSDHEASKFINNPYLQWNGFNLFPSYALNCNDANKLILDTVQELGPDAVTGRPFHANPFGPIEKLQNNIKEEDMSITNKHKLAQSLRYIANMIEIGISIPQDIYDKAIEDLSYVNKIDQSNK